MQFSLFQLAERRQAGSPVAFTSICSAHPMVIRAALRSGIKYNSNVLIEATCNQVNHQGGYTGMKPKDFVEFVHNIAKEENFDISRLILGGDHLGPNPWRKLSAKVAMEEAEKMIAEYAQAGFHKFHLDASMGCAGEADALDDETTAIRAARLAAIVETTYDKHKMAPPAYVIGTEVPPPGGATHELDAIKPTDFDAALKTIATHEEVFRSQGIEQAFSRVIALVVQPGVEFGDINVVQYRPEEASELQHVLKERPKFNFEAHSTDYQNPIALKQLVRDGNGILKVGPGLTFALREALYSLDSIAAELDSSYERYTLPIAMEKAMQSYPENWQDHYLGNAAEIRLKMHFSYSDRIRYYWNMDSVQSAVQHLLNTLSQQVIPETLVSQYMPRVWRTTMGQKPNAEELLVASIDVVLDEYAQASINKETTN